MAFLKTLVLCLAVIHFCEAIEFHVGGDNKASWQVPSSPDALEKWAQKSRFLIGDSIVLKYDGKKDSVVEVREADYKICSKSNPIKTYDDGNTIISLDNSGVFYFISGDEAHCQKGQKLAIRVLSANHGRHHSPAAPAPSPANDNHFPHHAPAPAPHNGAAALRFGFSGVVAAALIVVIALV